MLLTYLLVDQVYENYAADESENINLWPMLIEYLSGIAAVDRATLNDLMMSCFRACHLPIIKDGKKYQNTVLINSSSRHYSSRFFDYISKQYEQYLERETKYDVRDLANIISKEFQKDEVRVSQMSHSFGLLIKNEELFPDIFDRVINKIDQRRNHWAEYDLGRWEEAFNEWYLSTSNKEYTRSKAELSLEESDGEYYLKIVFPSSKSVPPSNYSIVLNISEKVDRINIPVGKLRGVLCSQSKTLIYPLYSIDIFGRIRAVDSTGVLLIDLLPSDFRFFNAAGNYTKSVSKGDYRVLMLKDSNHNLPIRFECNVSDRISLIDTTLEGGKEYSVNGTTISLDRTILRNPLVVTYPTIKGTLVRCSEVSVVLSKHPELVFEKEVNGLRISIKNYAKRQILNETRDVESGSLDLNKLLSPETGVYYLTVSFEGHRLLHTKYLLAKDLQFNPRDKIATKTPGSIPYTYMGNESELTCSDNEMFSTMFIEANGKKFKCEVKTPLIFFNPRPDEDERDWCLSEPEKFDSNKLGGTLKIAPGCIQDGESISLLVRSSLGTESMQDIVTDGYCSFSISECIQNIQSRKLSFGLDLVYNNHVFPILSVNTLGKYDIEKMNGIVAITPYKLTAAARPRFDFRSREKTDAGPLVLGKTELFDISKPCILKVVEHNMESNEEIVIFERNQDGIKLRKSGLALEGLSDYSKATHLLKGINCEPDVDGAIDIFKKLSDEGHAESALTLARLYLNSSLVEIDLQKSSDYFKRYLTLKKNTPATTD